MPVDKPTFAQFAHLLEPQAKTDKYKIDLKNGVFEATDEADHKRMMEALAITQNAHQPPQNGQTRPVVQKSKKFSEVVELYLEEKQKDNSKNTIDEKRRTYKKFLAIFDDLEINLFTKQELVAWKSKQLKLDIKATTINSKLGELHGLFDWAVNNGFYTVSDKPPTDGLKIGSSKKAKVEYESYEPFSNDDLKLIFNKNTYFQRLKKPDQYWLPLIALFTGARREEIASLKSSNIRPIDDVLSIEIEEGKNANARRMVPIHPKLIELGFLEYAKSIQSQGFAFLFPYLVDSANGKGKNAGRQFSVYMRDDLKITNDRKVFHSFRHTTITRFNSLHVNEAHIKQIVGHEDGGKSVHLNIYTHDVGLKSLEESMNKLHFNIDFDGIKLKDPTFYKFINRWKMIESRKKKLFRGKFLTVKFE